MPGHNGFGFHDDESISPAGIHTHQRRPKETIQATESGARLLSFEDRKLLSESKRFQCKPVARYEQRTDVGDNRNDERAHRIDLN